MNIAVNTRLLLHGRLEGIGWFTFETLKRIVASHPEHEFYFIFDRPYNKEFIFGSNVHPVVIGPQARHPVLYYTWFEISIRLAFRRIKPDIFLSPDGYLSLGTKVRTLAVFHDLNFEHYPEDIPWLERLNYRYFFRKYAARADRIATVSEFSKADIVKQYGVSPDIIDVVYNGANEEYAPVSNDIKIATRNGHTGGRPYFFFVGALLPRKNLINLFKAFDIFRKTDPDNSVLLIAGARKWWTGEISSVYEAMQFKEDVIFAGRLEASEMRCIIGSAVALTYVSYFEGFGIPIIEAFRCGTPVITSNVTSMPEIAGDAALLVDPFSPEEIASAMKQISTDSSLRSRLIEAGTERAAKFTWDKSAERLWQSIEKTVKG